MIGTKIGQYRVLQLLGEGGMGRVLLAEHAVLKTRHAIKMLHDQLSSNDVVVQRFLNEARAASAIGHRNVVEITHVDQVEGNGPWYLVMKFLEGQTLAGFLADRRPPLPQRLIVHIIGEALNGLHAAHTHSIIHRDLKPDNLYLTTARDDPYRTLLLDFGVAQLGRDTRRITTTGTVIGTPQYMAPEQHRGAAIDHRTDLWAMGAIVYEMTTGRMPYQADGVPPDSLTAAEIFHQTMTRPLVDPRWYNPTLTEGFATAISRSLALDPANRPPSAAWLAVALAEATPGDIGAPSGLELLRIYADELLTAVSRAPAPHSSGLQAGLAMPAPPSPHTISPGSAAQMSTLGATASQSSALAPPAPQRSLRPLGIGAIAIVVTAGVLLALRNSSSTAPAIDEPGSAAPAASVALQPPPPDAYVSVDAPNDATRAVVLFDASPDAQLLATPQIATRPFDAGTSAAEHVVQRNTQTANGTLDVFVLPWAEVWVDGKSIGQTPAHTRLPVGPHRVRLKNDVNDKTITVTITASKATTIDETW